MKFPYGPFSVFTRCVFAGLLSGMLAAAGSGTLRAQTVVYQHAGFQQGAGIYAPLNYVIRRYNETRDWLEKDMGQFHFPNGISFGGGCLIDRILIDAFRRGGTSLVSARGTDATGADMQRDLRCRVSAVGLGAGYSLSGRGSPATLAGISLDITSVKIWTRVEQQSVIRSKDLRLVQHEVSPSVTLFVQKQIALTDELGLVVRPWVGVPLRSMNFFPVNDAINHATAADDPQPQQKGLMMSAGVSLSFGIFIHL